MSVPQCSTSQVLIEGACFSQCPSYYTEASYVSPSACVLNVECPVGFASGGDFTICQKPTVTRTVVLPDSITGDCPSGTTFWDSTCSSVCPDGYSIVDGVSCSRDCPSGFLSSSSSCFKPVVIRDPEHATCPLHFEAAATNQCFSTTAPLNPGMFWLIAIGLLGSCFLIVFLVKDVHFSFSSSSPLKSSSEYDDIPERFRVDPFHDVPQNNVGASDLSSASKSSGSTTMSVVSSVSGSEFSQ